MSIKIAKSDENLNIMINSKQVRTLFEDCFNTERVHV